MRSTTPTIIGDPQAGRPYAVAAETFADCWHRITGDRPLIVPPGDPLPKGNVAIIGSDAANAAARHLFRSGVIPGFRVRYGTDDYHLLSFARGRRHGLILAGGCGRSTIYAVYDFFRRRAGVRYHWDGDVFPHAEHVPFGNLDVAESPRFRYRGQRYFAHRGLHRFQAEHWTLEDWQREIDWLLKMRFNLFMLRTGIDDLFQRAFPESCPYPPVDAVDPDAELRSMNDRTSAWPLRLRGELRRKVLQYAFDRDLIHPEDTGVITHWYSHTPSSFYRAHPDFAVMKQRRGSSYDSVTGRVWDIDREETWQAYWQLTATHIREFGQPRLFHTIGLAERLFGRTHEDNLKLKLHTYRKTQEILRAHYPDAPLLIASWDLMYFWKSRDVAALVNELDPERTILLDYTADHAERKTYRDWRVHNRFPWIFGIFHAFSFNNEVRNDYRLLAERLGEAAQDEHCQGLVLWPELSHSDTFLLHYLAVNSWRPSTLTPAAALSSYCRSRYEVRLAAPMRHIWRESLRITQDIRWGDAWNDDIRCLDQDPQFRILQHTMFAALPPARLRFMKSKVARWRAPLAAAPRVIRRLLALAPLHYRSEAWRRDAIDLARTAVNRCLLADLFQLCLAVEAWRRRQGSPERIRDIQASCADLMRCLGDLLGLTTDFSLYYSLRLLKQAHPVNPHFEQALKSNTECYYSRTQVYEMVRHVYQPELQVFLTWVAGKVAAGDPRPWQRPAGFEAERKAIQDRFYATPLKDMAPHPTDNPAEFTEVMKRVLDIVTRREHRTRHSRVP